MATNQRNQLQTNDKPLIRSKRQKKTKQTGPADKREKKQIRKHKKKKKTPHFWQETKDKTNKKLFKQTASMNKIRQEETKQKNLIVEKV